MYCEIRYTEYIMSYALNDNEKGIAQDSSIKKHLFNSNLINSRSVQSLIIYNFLL